MPLPRTRFLRTRLYLARAGWSLLGAALLVAIAACAVFTTTEPAALSLIFEPVSLLLLPGLCISLVAAGAHDFSSNTVLYASFIWYFIFFYLFLTWRYRRRARLIPGSDL